MAQIAVPYQIEFQGDMLTLVSEVADRYGMTIDEVVTDALVLHRLVMDAWSTGERRVIHRNGAYLCETIPEHNSWTDAG